MREKPSCAKKFHSILGADINMISAVMILTGIFGCSTAAKILIFTPVPSKSHHAVYQPIARGLAERGHDVDYYTPFPIKDGPPSLKCVSIDFRPVQSKDKESESAKNNKEEQTLSSLSIFSTARLSSISTLTIMTAGHMLAESASKHEAVQNLLKSSENYDLVVTAAAFGQCSFSALAHRFKAPMVQIVPVGDVSYLLEMTGSPENPAYMMNMFTPLSDRMSFFERVLNTFYWFWVRAVSIYVTYTKHQITAEKYLTYNGSETRPSIMEMTSDTALVLLNSHLSVGYSFPKASHVKEIGGVNVLPNKSLPLELKNFLDSATDGAIYFSLGSIVQVSQVAGDDLQKAFVNVFKKMKQKVLWKWEAENFPDKPSNVLTSKWFPQQDVLAHENMKVFITQGGLMSLYESVSRGVPLLGIPFFGDQRKNLKHGTTYGYAIQLEYNNLTERSIEWALDTLLNNPSFKLEAEKRAKLFHDRPMKPLDEAVYWIEYVLRHGNVLQPQSAKLPFYQLYLLDVLGFCLAVIFVAGKLLKIALSYGKLAVFGERRRKSDKID